MRRLSMINEGLMMQFQKCTVAKAHIRPSLALYGQENSSKPSNYVLLYYCYFSIFEFIHNLLMSVSSWVFTGRTPFVYLACFLVSSLEPSLCLMLVTDWVEETICPACDAGGEDVSGSTSCTTVNISLSCTVYDFSSSGNSLTFLSWWCAGGVSWWAAPQRQLRRQQRRSPSWSTKSFFQNKYFETSKTIYDVELLSAC